MENGHDSELYEKSKTVHHAMMATMYVQYVYVQFNYIRLMIIESLLIPLYISSERELNSSLLVVIT